jgi:hypothetical protein
MKTEPTEALKHLIDNEWLPDCFVDGFENKQYVVNNYIAEEAVEIAFSEGQSNPKIKQLEWEHGLYHTLLSKTSIGDYGIAPIKDGYHMYLYNKSQYYWLKDYVNTIDEAKQFAQADFENRVKECLITEL